MKPIMNGSNHHDGSPTMKFHIFGIAKCCATTADPIRIQI